MSWTCKHCGKANTPGFNPMVTHFMEFKFDTHHVGACGANSYQKKQVNWTTATFLVTCRKCLKFISDHKKRYGVDPVAKTHTNGATI